MIMHGAQMARSGRKRKSGYRRHPGGQLAAGPAVNYRAMAAMQPHRRDLPVEARLSPNATTELGRAKEKWQITQPQLLAGEEFARRTGQYLATIDGPSLTSGNGRWSGCNPSACGSDDDCECRRRRRDYQELQEVIAQCGRRVEIVVKWVVIYNLVPSKSDLPLLVEGLQALAVHLRLTNQGNRRLYENRN